MDESLASVIKSLLTGAAGITLHHSTASEVPLAAVPDGVELRSLEAFMPAPRAIDGFARLHRYEDFVSYVNDFKRDGARIFVEPELRLHDGGIMATAFLDYPNPGEPAWSCHRAHLVVSPSMEYQLLTTLERDGLMPQDKFALRLRDVARFCTSLSSADLVEIAQTLTLSSKGEFANIEDNFTGSVRFGYDVQVTAKSDATTRKNIEVPREVGFNLPVLLGGENADVVAELMYRVPSSKDDKVKMGIRIPDRAFIERAILEQAAESLGSATGLSVAVGSTTVPKLPEDFI